MIWGLIYPFMLTQPVIEPVNKWKGDRLKDRKRRNWMNRQPLSSARLLKVFFFGIFFQIYPSGNPFNPARAGATMRYPVCCQLYILSMNGHRSPRGWDSSSVITPQLNKQFVVLFLEWLTNDLLVVGLSEPPWAVWGLIYMIIGCFDDTLLIISTDWSRAGEAVTDDLVWIYIRVWLTCNRLFREHKRAVETKLGVLVLMQA